MTLPEKHDRLSASIASDVVFNNLRCEVACYGSANDFVCRITRQHLKPVAAEWNDGYLPPSNAGMLWIRSIDHQCLITGFVHKWLFPNSTDLDNGLDLIQQMLTVDQGQSKVNVTVIGANANQIYEFDGETMGTDYN